MAENLWVEQYRCEIEKEDRKEILDKAIAEEGLTEENALRKQYFEWRYEKNKKTEVDRFIRGWMSLAYLDNEIKSMFGKKRIKKAIEDIREDFHMDLAAGYGEMGQRVLYDEFYNTARLYISLCEEDKTYNSILLGLTYHVSVLTNDIIPYRFFRTQINRNGLSHSLPYWYPVSCPLVQH